MERIILGRTGLEINRMGFGGIPIQTVDEAEAVETVGHAIEAGVDFIDTSRAYTTSERRIGLALKQTDRHVVLATKTPVREFDRVRKEVETSLSELQVDYIDLYQCHFVKDMQDYQGVIAPGGTRDALVAAQKEGLIGHIGITSHSNEVLAKAVEDGLFDTIMTCFSFLEPKSGDTLIPAAQAKNIGVIAMKSLSGGVIENPEVAIKWALSQPGVAIIPGVEKTALFDQNWAVYAGGDYTLNDDDNAEIARIRQTWDKAFCRRCDYCQPCTEGIAISNILHLKSMARRMGMASLEQPWLAAIIESGRHCTACGECAERCPYDLPIPDLIRENLEWFDAQK